MKWFLLWVFLGTPLGLDLAAYLFKWPWPLRWYVYPWLVTLAVCVLFTCLYFFDASLFKGIWAS